MDPIIGGALLSGGLNLAGGVYSAYANKKEASKNRRWQEQMSNTSHTREVADLRNAGLNPILSATGGGGASTPSGATAHIDNPAQDVLPSAKMATLEKDLAKSQIDLNTTASAKQVADAKVADASEKKIKADTLMTMLGVPRAKGQAEVFKNENKPGRLPWLSWIDALFSARSSSSR